ncbi:putative recombination protein [Helianthus debilis subsp. tardiflorus]
MSTICHSLVNLAYNIFVMLQVVAVIKSCTPNGLGDMTVTLKDPTGTVSGTIHHKVLTEGDFRKGTCVGSVLILHKVSVFSPSRSTYYINITKRNLVKVHILFSVVLFKCLH